MSQGTEVIESHDLQVSLDAFNKARQALHSHPPGDLDRAAFLTDLGDSLRTRFDQLGDLNSLGEAVELFREALSLRLPGHRDRSLSLERLAITLQARFEQMGDLNSLSETIELHRQAQELRPPGHPDRHHTLNNLAISLQTRFEQLGNLDSLAEAVDLHRQALDLRPPVHPDRSLSLNNLANALKTRFEQLGNLESLAEAVDLYREALDLRPQGHPLRISSLRTLASALVVQSRGLSHVKNDPEATSPTQRCVSDLDEALSLYTEGLSSCTGGHPERINFLFDIGVCLVRPGTHLYNFEAGIRYLLEALRDPASSAQKAVEYFTSDLPLVEAGYQSSIEKTNHVQSSQRHHHTLLLEAYTLVIRLLPRAASLGMDHAGRLHVLSGAEAISSSAATRAIAAGRDAEVVEILEEGRGVFWSQALRLRTTDLDHLPIQDAQELRRLFQTLDTASVRDESMNKVQREQHIEQRRRLSNVAEALITDIRSRPGMSRFLLPPAFSSLVQSLPAQGFVVLLVASNLGHHALVLNRAKGLTANVELSPPEGGFSSKTVRASLPRDGHTSVDDASASRLLGISGKARRVPKEPLDQTLAQLWTLIVKPVIDVLGLEVCSCNAALSGELIQNFRGLQVQTVPVSGGVLLGNPPSFPFMLLASVRTALRSPRPTISCLRTSPPSPPSARAVLIGSRSPATS
jgi:tetratricopeptide (TPR) repeat protein